MLFISCFLLSLHLCHTSGREVEAISLMRIIIFLSHKLHLSTLTIYYIHLALRGA